ncbi:hypothetical protein [Amycolatopsis sp. NPDC049868]|uniref:hypothetical protein n=1 Tax=Amycolatopsis sp. NPDC049868 TaxID=3363934 RepID=UPI0037B3D549
MDDADVDAAVDERRRWLTTQLETAADRFHLTPFGDIVNTYDMRSAGSPARTTDLDSVWLRVVLEDPDYQPRCRWDSNVTANAITEVPKPVVLDWADWNAGDYAPGRRVRGEVMTLVSGTAISDDGLLRTDPQLPDQWWSDLDTALTALSRHPLPDHDEHDAVASLIGHVRDHLGAELDPAIFDTIVWTTAHGDLHWANLTGPQLSIADDWRSNQPRQRGRARGGLERPIESPRELRQRRLPPHPAVHCKPPP